MSDEKLEKQVSEYAKLAQENPNIDAAGLILNALSQKENAVSSKMKKWAYLISIGVPPFGLFFALKFYFFSEEEDATHVGNICVILTVISVVFVWITLKTMLSGSGTSMQQIEQITPQEIHDTLGN